jgi:hypothetical protein
MATYQHTQAAEMALVQSRMTRYNLFHSEMTLYSFEIAIETAVVKVKSDLMPRQNTEQG